ncbi:hypothetical protein WJX79_005084 [Trebouxia sp. C0005]
MSVRQRLLRGVKLVESALASCGKSLPHSKGFPLSVRPTAVYSPSERSLATPASYALFGGLAAYACYLNNPAALAEANVTVTPTVQAVSVAPVDVYVRPTNLKGLPKEIILYQYEVCPFCCKVKAFLDYNQIPYRTVEVSPLYKKELKWSEHKKVPVAVLDGDVVQDSSVIISRAVMMWGISNKLKKKYGIQGNLREELYVCGDQWVKALDGRNFLGGNQPNLADLAVFGVVKSVTGTDTFHDLLHKTDISEWYERMMAEQYFGVFIPVKHVDRLSVWFDQFGLLSACNDAEEVNATSDACKAYAVKLGIQGLRFNAIALEEPTKADLLQYEASKMQIEAPQRLSTAIIQLPTGDSVVEAMVDLQVEPPAVISWDQTDGIQPMVTLDDCLEAEDICKGDKGFQQLLRDRYDITDLASVACDPWYYGGRYRDTKDASEMGMTEPGRYIQCFVYVRASPDDNFYAHPLDVVVVVELQTKRVLQWWHHKANPIIPTLNSNFHTKLVDQERGWRTGLKPLNVVQPEGPSFTVDGNMVSWQKWSMRVSFNYREGLVLHTVGYEDSGRVRPIMHRGSMVEIIVPYGDPRHPFQHKCAFDVMDYGLGATANSLELGCDCLGHIKYFDGMVNNAKGEPMIIKKAVCMHEEDYGTLWKHTEYRTGHSEVRRSRRLVLSFISTIANYEYGFYWYFYQDGSIQYEVKLTGCLSTSVMSEGEGMDPTHGTLIAPHLNAQLHQHYFCVRLDMAVDDPDGGAALTVTEVNCEPEPLGPENPHAIGFCAKETELTHELAAIRNVNADSSRIWKIKNESVRNRLTGAPVAYKLMPAATPPMYAHPSSSHGRRGIFAAKHLWVTPHSEEERWPAGMFPLQGPGEYSRGIVEWTQQDRNLVEADCVIWHSFGVTHIPRIEDWPVMPAEHVGFFLKPFGFFDANPSLDIPVGRNISSREHGVPIAACPSCGSKTHTSKNPHPMMHIKSTDHGGRQLTHQDCTVCGTNHSGNPHSRL